VHHAGHACRNFVDTVSNACAAIERRERGGEGKGVGEEGRECKRVFITNVKGTFFGMSESEEASKRR
jgi:hypothetical protein